MTSRNRRHPRFLPLVAAVALAVVLTPLPDLGWMAVTGVPLVRVIAADPTPDPSLVPTDPPATPVPPADPSAQPTPDPTPAPTPDPGPTPTASPTPAPADTPTPSPDASAAPSPAPDATPTPDPAASPLPDPAASPSPDASASPTPEPTTTPIPWALSPGQQQGRLVGPGVPIYTLIGAAGPSDAGSSPHSGYSLTSPDCASCHATHTGLNISLVADPSPQSGLCFRCHGGSGSSFNTKAQFQGVPPNDAAADAWYSHPATSASAAHVSDSQDEFGGALNRHTACADCHSPHDASGNRPAQSTTGWTASGDIAGAAGVAVVNGAAGTVPAYTLDAPGINGKPITYEYELCLKCHSSRTTLPIRSAAHPSWWALDTGVELNPANASYHPVEAAGRNLTAQMAASLAGSSPFKAWDLSVDATVRCTQCHGDPSTVNQTATATPKRPAASAYEASHASPNRGLLIAPYRDRSLKPTDEAYSSADFGLCYLCHAERPFADPNENPSAADTAFSLHGMHLTNIGGIPGSGLSIDTAGAGEGLAICAECHFRIHSTAIAYRPGDTAPTVRSTGATSLVNFAPNVTGIGAALPTWTAPNAQGVGSCALTCHGFNHYASSTTYATAPGTGFTASPTSGPVGSSGLVVQFTDASRYASPSGSTWNWDFGDGTGASAQSPSHTYTVAGTYTVSLTVRRTSGNALATTMTRTGYVTVTP